MLKVILISESILLSVHPAANLAFSWEICAAKKALATLTQNTKAQRSTLLAIYSLALALSIGFNYNFLYENHYSLKKTLNIFHKVFSRFLRVKMIQ